MCKYVLYYKIRIEEEDSDDNDMNESENPPQNPNDEFDLSNYDKEEGNFTS